MSNRFHVAPEDLANMVEIARVSSYGPDKKAWTELALYYRDDPARPWVPVVEGRTDALDMSNRFQSAMMGTIERAMSWFEGSNLRDQLAEKVAAAIGDCDPRDWARDRLQVQNWQREAAVRDRHHAAAIERRGGIPIMPPGSRLVLTDIGQAYLDGLDAQTGEVEGVNYAIVNGEKINITKPISDGVTDSTSRISMSAGDPPNITGVNLTGGEPRRVLSAIRIVGITTDSLYEVLRWLYPDSASDSARSQLLERDFGMPARTTRRALAVECGDAAGELGAWVNMFIVTMRFFDRELWMAGQATIARVES